MRTDLGMLIALDPKELEVEYCSRSLAFLHLPMDIDEGAHFVLVFWEGCQSMSLNPLLEYSTLMCNSHN